MARLRAAGCVYAEDEAAAIVDCFPVGAARDAAVDRRCSGMPLEHVLGRATFAGVTVSVQPGVFVPRPRAAALVDLAAADTGRPAVPRVVLDLGCGSGAIAAALRSRHRDWAVHASDCDGDAVACARTNAASFGFEVHQGSWFDALPRRLFGRLDLVVAHLPYVPTSDLHLLPRDYRLAEPQHAVDGGDDGLDPWRAVATRCRPWLAPAGSVLTQVTQAQAGSAISIGEAARLYVDAVSTDEVVTLRARRSRAD